jgi:voltage-gated potassium channel Kch
VVLEGISPGSFEGISETTDLLYFSFVTLTTVGYGDIIPQSVLAKRLTVFKDGIYMALIIAMIVARYMSMQTERDFESKIHKKISRHFPTCAFCCFCVRSWLIHPL